MNDQWTQDIQGALGVTALAELLGLVDLLEEIQLTPQNRGSAQMEIFRIWTILFQVCIHNFVCSNNSYLVSRFMSGRL
ncbi:hypothetical protein PR202_ga10493 [Eleusine coracana subsp. coracana]|uniref:Uncharacterized protein n=1 Tax=Eleusine coracana subsp. coracana TaxID=191504 RepID=A0AAV5C6X1_ELECO|nr:hypothetical protein PR202_ga10493 [Eleusine coracana subsp. coracana]